MEPRILSIDQGTSSTKALLFDRNGRVVRKGVAPLQTIHFSNGFVEQNPLDILTSVRLAVQECLEGIDSGCIDSVGISNQRETFVLWDKNGSAIGPAVVWACKRSTALCATIKDQETWIQEKTGLIIDPYFSATKLLWLVENTDGLKARIARGEIFFGTVDTWLLFNLTGGRSYFTDYSNASRTMFFNLKELKWDAEILNGWNLKNLQLPQVKPSAAHYGRTNLFGLLKTQCPVTAMIGDSHAAMFGECCFDPGDVKMTLGTGCSLLMHTGTVPGRAENGMLTTIGWSTAKETVYALEGAIVACGSMIEWLRSLHILSDPVESETMAQSISDDNPVFLIPAFSGLGAPFWDMERKASFHGMTFGTTSAHLVRATLESICFQIKAVVDSMKMGINNPMQKIAMHGGLSKNKFIQQALNQLLNAKIGIQDNADISAQGAAFLAGLQVGIFQDLEELKKMIKIDWLEQSQESGEIQKKFDHWIELINH